MPEPDYPRIAYEAWATHQDWKDGDFDDIPTWERLDHDLQDAWESAIDAAFHAQIPGDAP
jgi:hypothetical protein